MTSNCNCKLAGYNAIPHYTHATRSLRLHATTHAPAQSQSTPKTGRFFFLPFSFSLGVDRPMNSEERGKEGDEGSFPVLGAVPPLEWTGPTRTRYVQCSSTQYRLYHSR